jgi:subtilisin-like proprotein convertase family protein
LYYKTLQTNNIQVVNAFKISEYRYLFTFPLIPYSEGLFYYIAAQDITPVPNFMTYPLGGAGVNPPGTISPPKFMFVRNTATVDSFYVSSDVPKPILTNAETTFVSVLSNPAGRMILDVNCAIDIEHTYDADLSVSLISPSGTEIVLVAGTGGDGDNFTNTYFDDEAPVSIDSSSAQAPYTGVFKPIERLWLFDGENSSGIWKLKVVDNGPGDGGTLLNWSMVLKYSTGPDYVIIPGEFSLVKNYPNPFNPKTRIVFNVPRLANVKIVIYDAVGREVKTVLNELRPPRLEDYVDFDARGFASGVYFVSLIAEGDFIESRKIVLLK